jgi:hypothetical protein
MRAEAWSGLATNASPFALPPGAAVKQVNLCTHIPGQLTLRGGMVPVAFGEGEQEGDGPMMSLAAVASGGGAVVLGLCEDGKLYAMPSPDRGEALGSPDDAAPEGGLFSATYTQEIFKAD